MTRNWKKKGEMGMGTLIIFIAMVLVAAVAAAVLISTTGSLQNKALATGKETKKEVGTSLSVIQVYAENGTNQSLDEYSQFVRLNAGSDSLRFADVLLSMSLSDQTADYAYSTTVDCGNETTTTAGGDYGVSYSINGSNHKDQYLVHGDVAILCYQSPRSVAEGEAVRLALVPKVGIQKITEFKQPGIVVDRRIQLFP